MLVELKEVSLDDNNEIFYMLKEIGREKMGL